MMHELLCINIEDQKYFDLLFEQNKALFDELIQFISTLTGVCLNPVIHDLGKVWLEACGALTSSIEGLLGHFALLQDEWPFAERLKKGPFRIFAKYFPLTRFNLAVPSNIPVFP